MVPLVPCATLPVHGGISAVMVNCAELSPGRSVTSCHPSKPSSMNGAIVPSIHRPSKNTSMGRSVLLTTTPVQLPRQPG
ncbi:hypothetical protein [Streptomyces laurentii]|uniref:hypothetical protein n=1 Tax=Streptomyces laurentii TaxID=39478 RepID=UPI00340E0F6B